MTSEGEVLIDRVKKTVAELRTGVADLCPSTSLGVVRGMSERITQELLKLDGVPNVNKQALSEAYRVDKAGARKIANLISRRKALIKSLNQLGETVDSHLATMQSSNSSTVTASKETGDETS